MNRFAIIAVLAAMVCALSSCDDGKSYAELLNEEDMYVNNYLADNTVLLDVPADTVFEYGPDAPYYRLNDDGTLYMQVLDPGTKGNMVSPNEQIYFRYTRWALNAYTGPGSLGTGDGNNLSLNPCWFRYGNYQIESSYTWGTGVQYPLSLLPVDCKVKIVIKSTDGPTSEQASVIPFLWQLTYERRQ
ncbi:MAG: DUF4827 domain-containing protein [Muribaculaceae bacterium]|nr:DUF4827 domain-containing protein [Muribaculaceae bacterium]